MKSKLLIVFFFLTFNFLKIYAQESYEILKDSINKKIKLYESNLNFVNTSLFFLASNWDSTLVYSARTLHKEPNIEINNYTHYFRGTSFQKKKLFKQAKIEFDKISKSFDFYYQSRMVLGEIMLEQELFSKAIYYFKQAEEVENNNFLQVSKSIVKHNLGICYLHLQQFDKAELYLLESNSVYIKNKDTLNLISSYGDIANLYYEQYKDDLAIPYFLKAYHLSKAIRDFGLRKTTAGNMSIVEENRKDFAKALTYRKEYEQWNDSLNNQNKIWETAQREKRDAIEKKQQEVTLLEADNRTRTAERNGFIYSSIALLILLGTGIYFYREKIKANKIIAAQKEALNELNSTKNYLFSVVSHDLRSPVNALRKQHRKLKQQIKQQDLAKLSATVDTSTNISESMYGLLNNVLHWSLEQSNQLLFSPESIVLQPIIEHVVYDFESLATAKSITIQATTDESTVANCDRESLKIVLRNLLDNAIKYTPEHGEICIKTSSVDQKSVIEITDTGNGFSKDQIAKIENLHTLTAEKIDRSKGVGLGLLLCVTLVRKNNGMLTIEKQQSKGSIIKITLPKT